jgi:hypothetical protein
MSERLDDTLITGRLLQHGAAPYQFRRGEAESYFVKIVNERGERTLWGADLKRALAESRSQVKIGDVVGLRRIARERVTVSAQERDSSGRTVRESRQITHRNQWLVESVSFFAERARLARRLRDEQRETSALVREHPELKSTFLTLRAAEEFAKRKIAREEDRVRFVGLVKEAIAGSMHRGEPLPEVRLRGSDTPERESRDRPIVRSR